MWGEKKGTKGKNNLMKENRNQTVNAREMQEIEITTNMDTENEKDRWEREMQEKKKIIFLIKQC